MKYQTALKRGVVFWKSKDLVDVLNYITEKYTKDFIPLFEIDIPFPELQLKSNGDSDIIRYFHKSLYKASKKNKKSPYEAWQDKDLVRRSALNRLKYVGNCKPYSVLKGFSITGIAPRVSVFKPKLAERLVKTYLSDYETVFDPFSGFSGRMLGAANCGKKYVGQDINIEHVTESNEIITYKKIQDLCSVVRQDILTDAEKTFACLFTCPPYGGKEHWNENNDEIEKSCDEWIDICLQKYKCQKYLFVVDKTEKYKNNIVETLQTKTLFGDRQEFVILISRD